MFRLTKWTGILIIANIAAYMWSQQSPAQADALIFRPALFLVQPWTAVTYMFLHAGTTHILFNMLTLYFFGPQVEQRLGGGRFLTLYFVSGLFGAATSMVLSPRAAILGASAAVFGVELAFAYFWPRAQILIWGIVPLEARTMVVLMTILSLFGGGLSLGNIAHFAHLGGFLGGWIALRAFGVPRFQDKLRPQNLQAAAPRKSQPPPGAAERWKRIPLDRLHPVNREEAERVLAKLDARGPAALTAEEQEFLDRFSGM